MKAGPGKLPPELLQKIKDSVSILEVIGEHVVLRKAGANFVGLCPFHSERSPSFSVSETKQLYHCYGCKRGGDLVSFVMDMQGIGFTEAVEDLADRAGLKYRSASGSEEGSADHSLAAREKQKLATAYKLNRFAAKFFHSKLSTYPPAQDYLNRRGLSGALEKKYYVGACPNAWDLLSKHLSVTQAPLDLACELGLIRPSQRTIASGDHTERGPGYFDLFRNRVIFPILNSKGKVAGFGGRVLGDEDGPKYLNSPESLVFQKGKLLFSLYQSQKYIREKDEVVVVEGYFDVMALQAAGVQNVVSTSGTALTQDHLKVLGRLAKRIVLLFDGDQAGISATERAMEIGLDQGLILYGASLPQGTDPDELVVNSATGTLFVDAAERVEAVIGKATPLLDVRMNECLERARLSPEDQVQSLKKMGLWLNRLTDQVGRDVRVQMVERELGVPAAWFRQTFLAGGANRKGPIVPVGVPTVRPSGQTGPGFLAPPQSSSGKDFGFRPATAGAAQGQWSNRGTQGFNKAAGRANSLPYRPVQQQDMRPGMSPQAAQLSPSDCQILAGLMQGKGFIQTFFDLSQQLPSQAEPAQLFDSEIFGQEIIGALREAFPENRLGGGGSEAGLLTTTENLGNEEYRDNTQTWVQNFLAQERDPELRSALTGAILAGSAPEMETFKGILMKRVARSWARFSQQIKAAIQEAELKKNAELQARLMKDYLDVQRKMKDFSSFYDEA